jgi:hypothetical protein
MPRRCILLVLVTIAMVWISGSGNLHAEELYGWVHKTYHGPIPYYVGNPKNIDPYPYAYPPPQGIAGPRAYPYGYFGTQSRPYSVMSENYYSDFSQWSFRRGY